MVRSGSKLRMLKKRNIPAAEKDSLDFAEDDVGQEYLFIHQSVVEKNHPVGPSTSDSTHVTTGSMTASLATTVC